MSPMEQMMPQEYLDAVKRFGMDDSANTPVPNTGAIVPPVTAVCGPFMAGPNQKLQLAMAQHDHEASVSTKQTTQALCHGSMLTCSPGRPLALHTGLHI